MTLNIINLFYGLEGKWIGLIVSNVELYWTSYLL